MILSVVYLFTVTLFLVILIIATMLCAATFICKRRTGAIPAARPEHSQNPRCI